MDLNQVLLRPIITEKSMKDAASGWYTFAVAKEASKREIKKAVETEFKVQVVQVKTLIIKGKTQRVGKKREEVRQSPWKKAHVKLKAEQKIDLFEVTK